MNYSSNDFAIEDLARRIRIGSLFSIYRAGSGHPGGSLSAADLLAYLWGRELNWDCSEARHLRDRFVLSKGHACPALYAAAAEVGLIKREMMLNFRKLGSPLQGHPHALCLPWCETSTGSLGQGFSASIGIALGLRHQKNPARVYVMLGDGELQEGEVWEGAMSAGHYRLGNLCAVIDYNKMQSDDYNENIMCLEPLADKWRAFNWNVVEIDGHSLEDIARAFFSARQVADRPTVIIAHTIKGKGVPYMEGSPLWHGSLKLLDGQFAEALKALGVEESETRRYLDGTIWQ